MKLICVRPTAPYLGWDGIEYDGPAKGEVVTAIGDRTFDDGEGWRLAEYTNHPHYYAKQHFRPYDRKEDISIFQKMLDKPLEVV